MRALAGIALQNLRRRLGASSEFSLSFAGLAPGAYAAIPGVSVTRASSATVQTGTSTLAHAAANEARVGRSSDADALGLLIEGSRTNYVTKSRSVHTMTAGGAASTADYAAGPDGTVSADRQNIAADGQSNQETLSGTLNGDFFVASEFVASTSGSAQHAQLVYYDGGSTAAFANDPNVTTWKRLATAAKAQAFGGATVIPADCRNQVPGGGTNPPAADVLLDFVQCEKGKYATSPIVTAGSSVVRAADLVTLSAGTYGADKFVSDGKFKLSLTFRPLCSLSQLAYDTALPVLLFRSADLACSAWINPNTRCLSVYAGGKSTTFTLPTWVAGDKVELAMQAGSGAAIARIRINGGAVTDLVGTGFSGATASASGASSLLSLASTHPLPCWLESVSNTLALASGSAGSAPSGTIPVVCEGNSITYGYLTTTSYPTRLQTALGAGYVVTNLAVSGSVIEAAADDAGSPRMSERVIPAGAYAAQRGVLVPWEFTNTLAFLAIAGYNAADSASLAIARWKRLVSAYRAMGFKVLALTMLPRDDVYITAPQKAVVEAARLICNASLVSDSDCGDYVRDLTQNVNLASVNVTYFNADRVHLTDAGNQEVANEVQAAFIANSL